ncbi:MAG TPA: Holliday junction resolvase RuvX [Dehalococcoidia bacterium]|nr:Holliday junction resolvase RuvX [Dehalococcoidia bacterium]
MRILALDIGEKRIGVAAADDRTGVAVPVATVAPDGDPVEAIARLVQDQAAGELVVGLPLSLSGALGPQAQRVQALVDALSARLAIPVHTWDERLTSVQAARAQPQARRPARRRGRPAPPASGQDAIAAAIILQAFLDSRRR